MRIAIVSPHFAEYAIRYAKALSAHHHVCVIVDEAHFERDINTRDIGARNEAPDSANGSLQIIKTQFLGAFSVLGMLRALKAFDPDIVHLQEASGQKRAFINWVIFWRWGGRAKLILTVHDPKPHSGNDASVEKRLRGLRVATRKRADVVLVHGESCRQQLLSLDQVKPEKIVSTVHGVLMQAADPRSSIPRQFLMFGRMEAYKGLEVLRDAIAALEGRGLKFTVKIMGKGPDMDRLAPDLCKFASVELRNGFIRTEDLIDAICESAFVVMPYINATQSGVLAAALGNARPVICSRVGGLPELIEDGQNGLLVPPGDAQALADAMARVLEDDDLARKLAAGAVKSAGVLLNWDHIVRELAPIYETRPARHR